MARSNYFNFALVPSVHKGRTRIHMPHRVLTTMTTGSLYPVELMEVLPGDTIKIDAGVVARVSSAFLKPVIDNAFIDVHAFFVPLRQVFGDAEKVFGVDNPNRYQGYPLSSFPVSTGNQVVTSKSVADYLGLPVGSIGQGISVLPFRAFAKIYDEWYRNQNVISEMYLQTGSYNATAETLNANAWGPANYTGMLPKVSKIKDIFTACLPAPQKGAAVSGVLSGSVPVKTDALDHNPGAYPLHWAGSPWTSGHIVSGGTLGLQSNGDTTYTGSASAGTVDIAPSNLYADLSAAAGFSINDLRFAFQLQKMLEVDARYGSRYGEYLYAHYGVRNPDLRIQMTEYLGGARIPINIQQVAQTSEGTQTGALAELGAFSLTVGKLRAYKSVSEHGYIIVCASIRTTHTYQQGIEELWFRKSREDFFDPLFANLGEQPVYVERLFGNFLTGYKKTVFGYNEYGAEYRYLPNRVTGEARSSVSGSLDIWHFGEEPYSSAPTLSSSFINETPVNMDRTLAVPSTSQDQFIVDFGFDTVATRVMPLRSVPGLIDHG